MSTLTTTKTHPIVDDYEVLQLIGRGAFGEVRRVRRRSDGAAFARKEVMYGRMGVGDAQNTFDEV